MAGSYEDFLGGSYDYNSQTFDPKKQNMKQKKKKKNSIL